MGTLKKFRLYLLMFIGFFLLVTLLTNFLMRDNYKNTKYEIKAESPVIAVTECKAAYGNGYIKGSINNVTQEIIPLKYLQINLYDKDGVYLGSEYKELKNFYPQETINFDISYEYLNIDKAILDFVDEIPQKKVFNIFDSVNEEDHTIGGVNVKPIITEETVRIAAPIAVLLVLNTTLGLF